MKRSILILLLAVMLLTMGTASAEASEGTVLPGEIGAVVTTLPAGTRVEILDEYGMYWRIPEGYIEKRLVLPEGEAAPESWTGYARWNASLYPDYHYFGEPILLPTNAPLEVTAAYGNSYIVLYDGVVGYISADLVSRWPATGGGGGGGGSADGGDISLTRSFGDAYSVTLLSAGLPAAGTVIVDGAEVYEGFLTRGEIVTVTGYTDELCNLVLNGKDVTVPRCAIRLSGDAEYDVWTGYSVWNGGFYRDFYLSDEEGKTLLSSNQAITVLAEFPHGYLVELNGQYGMMTTDSVRQFPATGGGGGGGGEWTPPMM